MVSIRGSHRTPIVALSLILFAISVVGVARPSWASNPDFTLTANPSSVVMPTGYWADTLLTVSSLNGLQGTVQFSLNFGTNAAGLGAGFNTGMYLNSSGQAITDMVLTSGRTSGNYTYTVTATIGAISHYVTLPVAIKPVSRPDFITRTWGSYAVLQDWNTTIHEQLTSINGFQGDVSLTATVSPNPPDSPSVTLQPNRILLSPSNATYSVTFSSNRETPVGNYVVAISVISGTVVHTSQALLMVGDYRPPSENQPPNNSTSTTSSNGLGAPSSLQSAAAFIASSALSAAESFWWLGASSAVAFAATLLYWRRLTRLRRPD